uniref:Transposon protein n=1 Tax=Arundo donax TaxID=35708 RepID=A0A0A9HVZ2_ARUDO
MIGSVSCMEREQSEIMEEDQRRNPRREYACTCSLANASAPSKARYM